MCRLFAFRSSVRSQVHRSLVAAENALALQSRAHPDGWGVAYYVSQYPHVYRNPAQAMDDGLFRNLGSVVSAFTLLAHIRRATVGSVGLLNCHPFQFGNWTFAHNGTIAGYAADPDIRAHVLELVAPRFRPYILGDTDSEVIFYLFLTHLVRQFEDIHSPGLEAEASAAALRRTVDDVVAVSDTRGDARTCLTMIATNGNLMLGHRFRIPLYYSTHKVRCPERDSCASFDGSKCEAPVDSGVVRHLVLASERVNDVNVWNELGDGEMVSVNWGMRFEKRALIA
jgi:glutamine amidotransferase